MKTTLLNMTFGLSVMILAAHQVAAEQNSNCAPRETVIDRLASGYGETRQSIGLGARGSVVEVFASIDTGTWTITVTAPNGVTCLVASGQSFETMADSLPPAGNDA